MIDRQVLEDKLEGLLGPSLSQVWWTLGLPGLGIPNQIWQSDPGRVQDRIESYFITD